MQVQVRLGAGLSRLVDSPRLEVELGDRATVGDLLRQLRKDYPTLEPGLAAVLPLVRGGHVGAAQELMPGEEVALLTPAAGG